MAEKCTPCAFDFRPLPQGGSSTVLSATQVCPIDCFLSPSPPQCHVRPPSVAQKPHSCGFLAWSGSGGQKTTNKVQKYDRLWILVHRWRNCPSNESLLLPRHKGLLLKHYFERSAQFFLINFRRNAQPSIIFPRFVQKYYRSQLCTLRKIAPHSTVVKKVSKAHKKSALKAHA